MKKSTDITIILDCSGSMEIIKSATIESFNSFIEVQQAKELPTRLSLMQFDDIYEGVYEVMSYKAVHIKLKAPENVGSFFWCEGLKS